jgi:hypothetical protein
MGWFNKKDQGDMKGDMNMSLPELPKLPELPELPPLKDDDHNEPLHKLPSFPNSSLGEKFSQNTIKEAIVGKQKSFSPYSEGKREEKVFGANEFVPQQRNVQMMQKPQQKQQQQPRREFIQPKIKEIEPQKKRYESFETEFETPVQEFESVEEFEPTINTNRTEPVFIRIDKFEESLKIFEKTKKEILDIEKALRDITAVREDEDKELENWQNDLVKIKEQIEKVDKDIFSKIE